MTWLCNLLDVDRRVAYLVLVEKCFKVGTDRHYWVDTDHANKFINQLHLDHEPQD